MRAPRKNSKLYKEVLKAGCGGTYDEWKGDYGCEHKYEWECDQCPIVLNNIENSTESVKWVNLEKDL